MCVCVCGRGWWTTARGGFAAQAVVESAPNVCAVAPMPVPPKQPPAESAGQANDELYVYVGVLCVCLKWRLVAISFV